METSAPPVWKGNAETVPPLRSSPRTLPNKAGTRFKVQSASIWNLLLRTLTLSLRDKYGRTITDLRVSVTDRCNYKCVYCRTGNVGAQFPDLPMADYLRMARLFVSLGITKVRITGGEPLMR